MTDLDGTSVTYHWLRVNLPVERSSSLSGVVSDGRTEYNGGTR